ncbi:cilia- and flagella-associated protein 251-like [Coccinella septempunctata]|uniref:cilia- and flagella-associated protein 251-like n=1 Tax=Coccinella septempunctata TaxID=41139 RepID=UPI001D095274|nr:cilia- and flagella-associated protein 251-like [Coccinella septempunctata]
MKNEQAEPDQDSVTLLYESGAQAAEANETKQGADSLSANSFEIFDALSPHDDIWKSRDFKKKINTLGPDIFKNPKLAAKVEPFKLEWAFGFNKDATVLNLYHSDRAMLLFNATQCGVLFDVKQKKMNFLQGHPNKVVAVSSTSNGSFLASADSGPDNIIVVWQTSDISPVVIFFDPYDGYHILNVALSPKGTFLVSVGEKDEENLRIDLRLWTEGRDEPDGQVTLENYFGKVLKISFNQNNECYFAVLFERAVAFLYWDEERKVLLEPEIPTIKYRGKIGHLTDMTYIERSHEAMVSTSEGCIIIFGNTLYYQEFDAANVSGITIAVKICKITKVSVNTIDSADTAVLTGDDKGIVNIFDKRLRLLFWYQQYLGKPVLTARFNMQPRRYHITRLCLNEVIQMEMIEFDSLEDSLFQDDAEKYEIIYRDTLKKDASPVGERWVLRDFIVVQTDTVSLVDFINNVHTLIYERGHDHVGAITVHDEFTYLVVGYKNGTVCLFDYMDNFLHVKYTMPEAVDEEEQSATITCIEYSPNSLFLACGRSNGEIWFLDPILLTPKQEVITVSNYYIEKIAFSVNNDQMAFCNNRTTVYMMIYDKRQSMWVFIGKTRSHYKTISEMFFMKTDPKDLVTLGMDRFLITYNNIDIQQGDDFQATLKVRIDQTAVPLSCEVYPPKHIHSPFRYFILTDDQHKYKLLNEETQMCRLVALGPAYGCYQDTPVKKIKLLPERDDDYLVFMTKKHFGLQKLPISGNPYSFVGCFGHAEELIDFKVSGDGDYVFTFGRDDTTVLRWKTETRGVDLMQNLGGQDFEPFYCVIEGGKNGFLFQEMQDLFFYMQILHEGENSTLPRRVSDKLAVSELPDLMRACGYYPTDFEIETFIVDIKYRDFDKDGTIKDMISFLEFVKLYVNHKPVYGYSLATLETNFNTFVECVEDPMPGMIKRDDFLELLTEEGEPFTLSQINKCMEILLGASGASEGGHYLFDFIPEDIDYDILIDDILGIDMNREKIDVRDSETKSENSSISVLKES